MTALEALNTLRERGVELRPDGEQLRYRAPRGVLNETLVQLIRAHKPDLMQLLSTRQQESVAERAAIMEYDGGLSRLAAEALARHGHVVDLPACRACNGMTYKYADGYERCTTPWCVVGKE